MSWKLYEMKVVSRDRIWPLMWVKALMYMSAESSEFFNFGEWCPHVEEVLMQSDLLQDQFALLNGHGLMDGTSIPHLCDNFDVKDCYFVVRPTLWTFCVAFGVWGYCSFVSSHLSPLCTIDVACVSYSWAFLEGVGVEVGGVFYQMDDFCLLIGGFKLISN